MHLEDQRTNIHVLLFKMLEAASFFPESSGAFDFLSEAAEMHWRVCVPEGIQASSEEDTPDYTLDGYVQYDSDEGGFVQAALEEQLRFVEGELVAPNGFGISRVECFDDAVASLRDECSPFSSIAEVANMFVKTVWRYVSKPDRNVYNVWEKLQTLIVQQSLVKYKSKTSYKLQLPAWD